MNWHVDENEGNNNNWINQCDFEICDNNKEFKPRSSNTNLTQKEIALKYNVGRTTITAINNGQNFRDNNLNYPLRK